MKSSPFLLQFSRHLMPYGRQNYRLSQLNLEPNCICRKKTQTFAQNSSENKHAVAFPGLAKCEMADRTNGI